MGSRKKRIARITSTFVALEAVFLYYGIMALVFMGNPGFIFNYLPGIGYVFRMLFPRAWSLLYPSHEGRIPALTSTFSLAGPFHFLFALWIVFISASIVTAIVYAIKLREAHRVVPNSPSPSM